MSARTLQITDAEGDTLFADLTDNGHCVVDAKSVFLGSDDRRALAAFLLDGDRESDARKRPLLFIDTETTGLEPDDEIWEFAAIRREVDGRETSTHIFIEHDIARCSRLPEAFAEDHKRRFPISDTSGWHPTVLPHAQAAEVIASITDPNLTSPATVVGAVPNFDTERIERLLRQHGFAFPRWHHRLRCAETLACGRLGREVGGLGDAARALGLKVDPRVRHTAMGDAVLAMRVYDAVMGGAS